MLSCSGLFDASRAFGDFYKEQGAFFTLPTTQRSMVSILFLLVLSIPGYAQSDSLGFEVASIRPSAPQEPGRVSSRLSVDKGRFLYTDASVLDLISYAYTVSPRLVIGPSWLGTDRFDVNAGMPQANTSPEPNTNQMVGELLWSRFGLEFHRENRHLPSFVLSVDKKRGTKLKRAESGGGLSAGNNNKDHLAYIAGRLPIGQLIKYLEGQLDRPILDQTHLMGPFTIDLKWVPDLGDTPQLAELRPPGPSLISALHDQAGLALKAGKANVEVIVVDKINKIPTDN